MENLQRLLKDVRTSEVLLKTQQVPCSEAENQRFHPKMDSNFKVSGCFSLLDVWMSSSFLLW